MTLSISCSMDTFDIINTFDSVVVTKNTKNVYVKNVSEQLVIEIDYTYNNYDYTIYDVIAPDDTVMLLYNVTVYESIEITNVILY